MNSFTRWFLTILTQFLETLFCCIKNKFSNVTRSVGLVCSEWVSQRNLQIKVQLERGIMLVIFNLRLLRVKKLVWVFSAHPLNSEPDFILLIFAKYFFLFNQNPCALIMEPYPYQKYFVLACVGSSHKKKFCNGIRILKRGHQEIAVKSKQ